MDLKIVVRAAKPKIVSYLQNQQGHIIEEMMHMKEQEKYI